MKRLCPPNSVLQKLSCWLPSNPVDIIVVHPKTALAHAYEFQPHVSINKATAVWAFDLRLIWPNDTSMPWLKPATENKRPHRKETHSLLSLMSHLQGTHWMIDASCSQCKLKKQQYIILKDCLMFIQFLSILLVVQVVFSLKLDVYVSVYASLTLKQSFSCPFLARCLNISIANGVKFSISVVFLSILICGAMRCGPIVFSS